jgi:uncharacterized protein (DUF305 family)
MRATCCFLAASLVFAPGLALAQEAMDTAPLPPICKGGAGSETSMSGMKMSGMKMSGSSSAMMQGDDAHQALMAGMGKMDADMMAGAHALDIDVAFNCAMIPHHQGAISMARAELKYGKDPESRKLAEGIIAAQEQEIAGMLDWLKKRTK